MRVLPAYAFATPSSGSTGPRGSIGQSVRRVEGDSTSPLEPDDAHETCPSCRFVDAAALLAHRATVLARHRASVRQRPLIRAHAAATNREH
jgi:hypothetical protein